MAKCLAEALWYMMLKGVSQALMECMGGGGLQIAQPGNSWNRLQKIRVRRPRHKCLYGKVSALH